MYEIGNMRLQKDDIPFTMVANEVLRDPRLSLKAKGMYAYLFSKPDDWDFSNLRIANEMSDGRHAVLAALKELEELDLLGRIKQSNGRMDYHLKYATQSQKTGPRLFDSITTHADPKSENPKVRKPHSAKTRPISNTVLLSNTEKESNTESSTPGEFARKFFSGDPETCAPIAQQLEQSGIPAQLVARELLKFQRYWTEPTKNGKKQLWETKPTFEVKRRLGTWFRNIAERGSTRQSAGAGVSL